MGGGSSKVQKYTQKLAKAKAFKTPEKVNNQYDGQDNCQSDIGELSTSRSLKGFGGYSSGYESSTYGGGIVRLNYESANEDSFQDMRKKTLKIVFDMIPHHCAPTMTETIMETLQPLFDEAEMVSKQDIFSSLNYHNIDHFGDTLLIAAVRYGFDVLVKYLLITLKQYNSLYINTVNFGGQTALHVASSAESISLSNANMLVQNGAYVSILDNEGCTPLHFAASAGNLQITELLVCHESSDCIDIYGYSALDYALTYCHYPCVNLLKEKFLPKSAKKLMRKTSNQDEDTGPESGEQGWEDQNAGEGSGSNTATRSLGDWLEYWCSESEAYYYYNNISGESVWEKPEVFVQNDAMMQDAQNISDNRLTPIKVTPSINRRRSISSEHLENVSTPKCSPLEKWKQVALSVGKQRVHQKQHGIAPDVEPSVIAETPGKRKGNSLTPGSAKGQKSSIEKEITRLIRVVHSGRTTVDGMVNEMGTFDQTEAAATSMLENERLMELQVKYDENERALHNLQNKKSQDVPESEDCSSSGVFHSSEEQFLAKRSELSALLEEQKKIATQSEAEVKAQKEAYAGAMKKINNLKEEIFKKEEAIHEANKKMKDQNMDKEVIKGLMQEQAQALEEARNLAKQHAKETDVIRAQQAEDKKALVEARQRILMQKAAEAEQVEMAKRLQAMEEENNRLKQLENDHLKLKKDFAREHNLRKKAHNELEKMKGSIRVLARVRPLSKRELKQKCKNVLKLADKTTLSLSLPSKRSGEDSIKKEFSYDTCFPPISNQEQVFQQVAPLIQSSLDGYNVCIFAYGQTGSGKTYTMSGPDSGDCPPESMGITPRATQLLFDAASTATDRFSVEFTLTMIELYRGNLIDLLNGAGREEKPKKSAKKKKYVVPPSKLCIKKDHNNVVYVENATEVKLENIADLQKYMRWGTKERHTSSTLMNSASSRSHLIMTIRLNSTNKITSVETVGKLTLVDLAGSERQSKTGSSGETLKEAQSINKSLSALGNVISAITEKKKHIPYRNDLLTQLLSDSLGGNAKTLMFVNLSPADYNAAETCNSLQFASRVKNVTNKAKKQIENKQISMLKEQLRRLKEKQGSRPCK